MTREAGYDGIGLYAEHRFAWPSAPWAAGRDAMTPDDVRWLRAEFPDVRIVPFLNLLGHCEGMIYTEEGQRYAAERFAGMQTDPTNPAWVELCGKLVDDALSIFNDEMIHLGGDETWQLGLGKGSAERVALYGEEGVNDPKARLYAEHFAPLAQRVLDAGRTPAVWGDMFFDHPDALSAMPKETVIFDWQYFKAGIDSAKVFADRGFRVVVCPAVHTYNALWCHLPQTERNVRDAARVAATLGAEGVCVTTWEHALMANYETTIPILRACGKILQEPAEPLSTEGLETDPAKLKGVIVDPTYADENEAPTILREFLAETGEAGEEWARIMGIELQAMGGTFAFSGHRSKLKCRMLLWGNPFLLWLRDREEFLGERGDQLLELFDRATAFSQGPSQRGIAGFGRSAVNFVRLVEESHEAYVAGKPGEAAARLAPCRQVFEDLATIARATAINAGGGLADAERCAIAKEHVERSMRRIKQYGDGSLGYLPSFETITHPKFVPHDQGNWWLINRWGNE